MASPDAIGLLTEIRDLLSEIHLCLSAPKAQRRQRSKRARLDAALAMQGRAASVDANVVTAVLEAWQRICPDLPQPLGLTDERRLALADFWRRMNGKDGVEAAFETVVANDWLCGRTSPRARTPIGLFDVVKNILPILEGTHR